MREEFSVTLVCQILEVSRSGFHTWRSEQISRREVRDRELTPLIGEIFWHHKRRYGARRIAEELQRRDIACGVARVARLMKALDLQAIQPPNQSHRPYRNKQLTCPRKLKHLSAWIRCYKC